MPSTYKPFVLAVRDALEVGAKAFHCKIYDEDVSYLTRAYPELSRQMIVSRSNNLSKDEASEIHD